MFPMHLPVEGVRTGWHKIVQRQGVNKYTRAKCGIQVQNAGKYKVKSSTPTAIWAVDGRIAI
jgi:hypothetical protein